MREDDLPTTGSVVSFGRALDEMRSLSAGFRSEVREVSRAMKDMDQDSRKLSRSLSSSLRSAFDKAVFGGEKLSTVFRDLASSVAGKVLNSALTPVTNALSGGISSAAGGLLGSIGSALGFANGGAFLSGRVTPFARGGVVAGPTLFPMRGGTGLMGEAGPEAIMPLSRGPDGKLGVAAAGSRGAAPIVINISTPDLEGFKRSKGQVSAQLARAVRRGQGGL
ncbi:MAG: phage tail tape measure protein [Pseudomonadota bacterium]